MPIVEQLQADREKQLERQKTIEENIGLVHACAHRFQGKGIETTIYSRQGAWVW